MSRKKRDIGTLIAGLVLAAGLASPLHAQECRRLSASGNAEYPPTCGGTRPSPAG
ncbi:hypothetical protein [Zobellella denitrificans]|uniref:hypothetical protein n=1 Tax=Zobellella denitrificans TaxID=347534 RepID=UPI001595BFD1|nr:hypothetical protein [Zobellella denitrificans]